MAKLADILFLMTLLCGCTAHHDRVGVTGDEAFREGDMVLRCGWGLESQAVVQSSHSVYSHIGLLHYDTESAQWMVVHAVPGEAAPGQPECVKCEPLSVFYAPDRAKCGAWMRADCPDSIAAAAVGYALHQVASRVTFDNDYLLSDTTQLYCTELIYQAFLHQGLDLSDGHRHPVPTVISEDGACIFPCDIESSSKIIFVQPFNNQTR